MANIERTGTPNATPLTAEQKQALDRLHQATTQLEGVFVQMMVKAMQDTVPTDSVLGGESSSEQTWQDMLTDERAQAIAKGGGFGISRVLDEQLRAQVLADAKHEANVQVDGRIEP